jgi:protein-S-isoprenylcysteine O-methyltransferase Ste14
MSGFTKSVSRAMASHALGGSRVNTSLESTTSGANTMPLSRAGDVALFLLWAVQAAANSSRAVHHARSGEVLSAVHVSTVVVIMLAMGSLFLIRGRPTGSARGLRAKFVALIGTWSIVALALLPLTWQPNWLLTGTTLGLIAAYAFVFWALLTLRRSFSIFAEARQLVRHGPYRLVRHPLYVAHITCYVLICLPRISAAAVVLAVLGISGEMLRARNEERTLSSVFLEYAAYAERTPRFVPRLHIRRPAPAPLLPIVDVAPDQARG